jgi:UDP-N-acetylmuramoylalanine--D-glutamate ligase
LGLDESDADSVGIIEVDGQHWLAYGKENRLLCVEDIRIAGTHNLSNVAAAFAIAVAAGWNTAGCVKAVKAFTGLPHRCQWVAERHGVRFFNDSKGTNIGATVAAIEGLGKGRNIVLIAGGDSKGADFSQLAPMVRQHVRHLVLIGRDAEKLPMHAKAFSRYVPTLWQMLYKNHKKLRRRVMWFFFPRRVRALICSVGTTIAAGSFVLLWRRLHERNNVRDAVTKLSCTQ